jgi:hypothetical protein
MKIVDLAKLSRESFPALPPPQDAVNASILYIHNARGRQGRSIDDATEQFVEDTRMGTSA